jgi:hypothetical protein
MVLQGAMSCSFIIINLCACCFAHFLHNRGFLATCSYIFAIKRRFAVLHLADASKDKLPPARTTFAIALGDGVEGLSVLVRTVVIGCVCSASVFGAPNALVQQFCSP